MSSQPHQAERKRRRLMNAQQERRTNLSLSAMVATYFARVTAANRSLQLLCSVSTVALLQAEIRSKCTRKEGVFQQIFVYLSIHMRREEPMPSHSHHLLLCTLFPHLAAEVLPTVTRRAFQTFWLLLFRIHNAHARARACVCVCVVNTVKAPSAAHPATSNIR
jgi:hypothetical protein